MKSDADQPRIRIEKKSDQKAHKTYLGVKFLSGRAVLYTIQEGKITVVGVSIEAVIASNEERGKRR